MKKIHLTLFIILFSFLTNGQNDTLVNSKEKTDSKIEAFIKKIEIDLVDNKKMLSDEILEIEKKIIDSIFIQEQKLVKLNDLVNSSSEKINYTLLQLKNLKDSISNFKAELSKQVQKIEVLVGEKLNTISSKQAVLRDSLNFVKSETNNKFSKINQSISIKTVGGYLLIIGSIILAISLFFVVRKKINDSSNKLDNDIEITKTKLTQEQLKLDQKLIELYESKLVSEKTKTQSSNEEEDHSLALKIADEIVRMQKNISNMPSETKGLKQLSRALQRMQDTFKINNYEMIEMLGKSFNEGMKVVANFVPDENLSKGQQIITKIIKPQVNYRGVMIQSAQIEVSIGE
tara:strand:- start:286 stop:1320 length:1035 start_codon:yes stop_codon:yes gene_type:complete